MEYEPQAQITPTLEHKPNFSERSRLRNATALLAAGVLAIGAAGAIKESNDNTAYAQDPASEPALSASEYARLCKETALRYPDLGTNDISAASRRNRRRFNMALVDERPNPYNSDLTCENQQSQPRLIKIWYAVANNKGVLRRRSPVYSFRPKPEDEVMGLYAIENITVRSYKRFRYTCLPGRKVRKSRIFSEETYYPVDAAPAKKRVGNSIRDFGRTDC